MEKEFNETKYGDYTADTTSVYKKKLKKYIENYGIDKGNLLDIGCNDGLFGKSIKGKFNLYGIDISELAINKAKQNGFNAITLNLNDNLLPYGNDFFDIIIMSEVLEHLFDTDKILMDINRVLKKGGVFGITVPNIAKHINRINLLFGRKMTDVDYHCGDKSAGHIRVYYTSLLKNQLKYNGFKILKVSSSFHPYGIGNIIIDSILYKLGNLLPNLGDHAIIICTKK